MPRGDAARIRAYAVELVDDARTAGDTGVTVRAGGVRDALELHYRKALINICQVLGTRKLQGEAGVELVARRGPVRASTRSSSSVSSEAGHCPGRRRRTRPCSRPLWTGPKAPALPGGRLCLLGPGVSPGLEAGRDSARTHRSNAASSPDTGGSAVSAGRRCVERETVLAVPGCGSAAVGPLPIPPEARWPGRRGGSLCHRHRRATVAHCHHWLLPLVRLLRNGVASRSPRFSSIWRGQGEFKDTVH